MLIIPSTLHVGMTPQIMVLADQTQPAPDMTDWLIAQCHAQQLNAVLLAHTADDAAPLHSTLHKAGIRAQVIVRPRLDAATVHAQAQDRRVRWVVLPTPNHGPESGLPGGVAELLTRASYPILLARGAG